MRIGVSSLCFPRTEAMKEQINRSVSERVKASVEDEDDDDDDDDEEEEAGTE